MVAATPACTEAGMVVKAMVAFWAKAPTTAAPARRMFVKRISGIWAKLGWVKVSKECVGAKDGMNDDNECGQQARAEIS